MNPFQRYTLSLTALLLASHSLTGTLNANAGAPVPPAGLPYHGPDLIHASWQGKRTSNGGPCTATYRTLDYSRPTLLVSFQLGDDENYDSASAGLFEIDNMPKSLFEGLILETKNTRTGITQSGWSFDLSASTAGSLRVVEMYGEYADANQPVTRRLTGTLTYDPKTQGMRFRKTEERKRVLFGFGTVFEDECVNMKPLVRYQN